MNECEKSLLKLIEKEGPIALDRFMSKAVSYYYDTRDPLGASGDFITAPEVSQMFGELIAVWICDIWNKLGKPKEILLVELGPGKGTLMNDIYRVLSKTPELYKGLKTILVENSSSLINKQKSTLVYDSIYWCKDLMDPLITDSRMPVIIIGNEFLDALPIKQYQKKSSTWKERVVDYKNQSFFIDLQDIRVNQGFAFPEAKENEIYEYSIERIRFVSDVCQLLKQRTGAALFIDYGHTESLTGDTLQALKEHRYVELLMDIGNSDITSHVDFKALKSAADKEGVFTYGPITQRDFLHRLGIGIRLNRLQKVASPRQKHMLDMDYDRLCSDKGMGGLFKVMSFCFDKDVVPEGFL
jgi:NADH dehydrogenase [ubiquinone] 1 alpha subcomplex assembly factor 7